MPVSVYSFYVSLQNQVDSPFFSQLKNLFSTVRCSAESVATVDQGYFFGNISQEYGPVKRRIAAACQYHFTPAESFRIFYHVGNTFTFKLLQMVNSGFAWFKAAKAAGNYYNFAMDFCTIACGGDE